MKITDITYIEGRKVHFNIKNVELELSEIELGQFRRFVGFMIKLQYTETTALNIGRESRLEILDAMEGVFECMDKRKLKKYSFLLGANRRKELTDKIGHRKHFKGVVINEHSNPNVITYKRE